MSLEKGVNSYNTLEELSGYHLTYGNTTWASSTAGDQEAAAMRAMRYIENCLYKGSKTDPENQLLQWPRIGVVDRNGYAIPDDITPVDIASAHAEAALIELDNPNSLTPSVSDPGIKRVKKLTGAETEWFSGGQQSTSYTTIDFYLYGYVRSTHSVEVVRS